MKASVTMCGTTWSMCEPCHKARRQKLSLSHCDKAGVSTGQCQLVTRGASKCDCHKMWFHVVRVLVGPDCSVMLACHEVMSQRDITISCHTVMLPSDITLEPIVMLSLCHRHEGAMSRLDVTHTAISVTYPLKFRICPIRNAVKNDNQKMFYFILKYLHQQKLEIFNSQFNILFTLDQYISKI